MNPTVYADTYAASGNRRCGFLLALFFAVSCLFANPAMADQAKIDKAIVSYTGTTLPAIAKMKPLIGKSASERAKAFAKMGIGEEHCDAAALDAIYGHQHLAEGAANLCRALITWMQDDDIIACSQSKNAGIDLANTYYPHDPIIAKRHKSAGVANTLSKLQVSAGCTKKDVRHWGARVLQIYDSMSANISPTGGIIAATAGGPIPTSKEFRQESDRCHAARNIDDATKIGVVEAANDGCYAMMAFVNEDVSGACESLALSLEDMRAYASISPLDREISGLTAKLKARRDAPICAPTLSRLAKEKEENALAAAALAAEKERIAIAAAQAAAPTQAQQANALIGIINGEQQSYNNNLQLVKSWDDRGETRLACGYTQKALNNLSVLQETYGKLGDVMRTTEHREEIARLKKIQNDYYISEWESCKEAGYLLAN